MSTELFDKFILYFKQFASCINFDFYDICIATDANEFAYSLVKIKFRAHGHLMKNTKCLENLFSLMIFNMNHIFYKLMPKYNV